MSESSKSILFNRASRPSVSLAGQLKMAMFKAVCELCDVVSFLPICPSDSSMMMTLESTNSDYWIPSIKVQPGESWERNMAKDLLDLFGGTFSPKVLRLNKLWLSNHKFNYINHTVFQIDVNADQKKKSKSSIGRFRGKVRWVTEEELMRFCNNRNLKSPELMELFYLTKTAIVPPHASVSTPGYNLCGGNFLEVNDDVVVTGKATIFEQTVDASGIDRGGQETLYREFLLMCFPAIYMSLEVFSRFLVDVGWPKDDTPNLFRAADASVRNGLSFRDFLYFIAAVEPSTNHGGGPAELRCRLIFRYFDSDRNNLLKRDELRCFVVSVRKFRKQPLDAAKVDKELEECYKSIGVPETHSLTLPEFLKAVGELKVRGTSQIFRAPSSIQRYIKDCLDRDMKAKALAARASETGKGKATDTSKSNVQPYAKGQEFELAVHTIKIQKSGTAINVDQLFSLDSAVSFSTTKVPIINEVMRRVSVDQFSQTSQCGELLKALRYLSQVNKKMTCYLKPEQMQFTWGQLDCTIMAKILMNVCQQVKDVFMKEQRLLDLNSPVYVMGDLHGNFADLLYFEKVLWHVGPGLCPCNLLFLGDYVDRGAFSIEVISYLFSYKLQSPKKLKLLRGNHEIKRVQIQWTFEKECKIKFGEKLGAQVFNAINDAFDTMPMAAVIDGRVFCCHGGIPPPWLCPVVGAINDIPVVLTEPQNQSPLAWELMWNDPVRTKHLNEKITMELLANEGFAMNFRRGTAHIFNVDALENFLKVNGFTHMIRAHEVVEAGFHVQQKGKLLTVFSSSKYCGGQNEAACILVDQGKLRILRLETE